MDQAEIKTKNRRTWLRDFQRLTTTKLSKDQMENLNATVEKATLKVKIPKRKTQNEWVEKLKLIGRKPTTFG